MGGADQRIGSRDDLAHALDGLVSVQGDAGHARQLLLVVAPAAAAHEFEAGIGQPAGPQGFENACRGHEVLARLDGSKCNESQPGCRPNHVAAAFGGQSEDVAHGRTIERDLRIRPRIAAQLLARRLGIDEKARQPCHRTPEGRRHVEARTRVEILRTVEQEHVVDVGQHASREEARRNGGREAGAQQKRFWIKQQLHRQPCGLAIDHVRHAGGPHDLDIERRQGLARKQFEGDALEPRDMTAAMGVVDEDAPALMDVLDAIAARHDFAFPGKVTTSPASFEFGTPRS